MSGVQCLFVRGRFARHAVAHGDGGGRGGFSLGPIGDLFRSLFYMTATAGIMLGVACAINEEARLGVKDLWKDVKRMLKGKKRRKRRRRSKVSSSHGRGTIVEQ